MAHKDEIEELIKRWPKPSIATFSRDLGIPVEHGSAIKRRGSIPVKYWPRVIDACQERGIPDVSYDLLVSLHSEAA